ncbi:Do family serine endopeptidase [Helicobacter saguini]|nr:Do family serine endopeptidase [Helicobacter saguini]
MKKADKERAESIKKHMESGRMKVVNVLFEDSIESRSVDSKKSAVDSIESSKLDCVKNVGDSNTNAQDSTQNAQDSITNVQDSIESTQDSKSGTDSKKSKKLPFIFVLAIPLILGVNLAHAISDAPPFTRVNPGNASGNAIISYHDAIKNATKAVVNITTETKVGVGGNSPFNDPFFRQFFGDMVPQDRLQGGIGSGVIITNNGYIVTNSHVVRDADKIYVTLPGSTTKIPAKLIGEDVQSDIAVIKIEKNNLPTLPFADSTKYAVGDVVFAIGNPFGVGESVTQGIISAVNKTGFGISSYENFIQTDASINPGNSGGALIDSRGALIGMNTAIISKTGGNHGIGFAIPAEMVKSVASELMRSGKVRRGFIGVSIQDIDSDVENTYGDNKGVLVVGIQANSPAQKAGLAVWDLITAVNGKQMKNAAELRNYIGSLPPNSRVTLNILRSHMSGDKPSLESKQIVIQLAEQPSAVSNAAASNTPSVNPTGSAFDGIKAENLNGHIRQVYRIPSDVNGALITEVNPNSKAASVGFSKGDIIAQIENMPIKNTTDLQDAINKFKGKKKRVLVYNVNGSIKTIIVQ